MVVYLEPLDANVALPTTTKTINITQQDKAFAPYVSVMQSGQSVRFDNQDDITHQIYSPIGDNKFSFKISAGQQQLKGDFNQTGEIAMGCNIHDWMSGHLLILDTPYFAKTNQQGQAKITIEQAGKYTLSVWHPQMNEKNNRLSQIIDLQKTTNIEMKLTTAMDDIPEQINNDDDDYLFDY